VISQGKTLRSARTTVRDALRLMAETRLDEGKPLPQPNPRAKDKKAAFQEKILLKARFQTGAVR
jgi:predicted RNase H-like HicB family nuclease